MPILGLAPARRALLPLLAACLLAPAAARAAPQPTRVLVAVLPFQVHSARPLSHLEASLADLLSARLEASGQVRVVDAVVVREALVEHAGGTRTDAALRELARRLEAAWIVQGSLTELAGRYSLDVRVVPLAPQGFTQSRVLTAASEDELLGRLNDLAAQVLGVVSGETRYRTVADVRLFGLGEVAAAWLARLETRAGRPYDGDAVRRDLVTLGSAPGVEGASFETGDTPEGVVVTFLVTRGEGAPPEPPAAGPPTAAALDVPPAAGPPVSEVRIRGNRRIEANAIRARLVTREGEPTGPARIASDVRAIYGLGFFRNVRAWHDVTPDGVRVTFEVEENPVVRQITIAGNDALGSDRIRDSLTLTTGSALDHPLLFENRERIEALYRAEGYYLAQVEYEIETLPGDAAAVHFEVDEGAKLRLRRIRFEGNQHFSDDELAGELRTKPWRFWSYVTRFLDRSGSYREPVFLQDLQTVERKYLDAGYLQVEVGEPDVTAGEDGLAVTTRIREGERFRVGRIDLAGDATADLEALRQELGLVEGEFFNRSELTEDVEKLTRRYTDRGYYLARVNPVTQLSEAERTVDIAFEVEKGPLYFVREIEIAGNTRTVDPVIRRELQLVEGQLYSARALSTSQRRIQRLGFFEEVEFEPRPTDLPDQVDLGVNVVERPTGALSFGAGFSSQDKLVLSGSVSQANLFGRGYGLQASVDAGGESDRVFLSFSNPYLLGSTFSFGSTLFRTSIKFEDFEQEQQGLDFTLGHALDEENRARGFLRYSFADREIDEDSDVNASSVIFRQILSGSQTTSLMALSFRADTRNDLVLPSEGWQLGSSLEFAGLGGFAEFLRLEGRASWYARPPRSRWLPIPLADRSTFVLAGRFGWVLPFNDIGDFDLDELTLSGTCITADGQACALDVIDDDLELPLTERYFLGGLGTFQLRGFRARSVGPRRALLRRSGLAGTGDAFLPVGRGIFEIDGELVTVCIDDPNETALFLQNFQGDKDRRCNDIDDEDIDDFEDLDETDVIGGNKFLSLTAEYRFPISEALGLVGIVFLDAGNAFSENENVFDVDLWRVGTGLGVLWFSPFGPIQAFWGVPLDPLDVEDSNVFEFSVGGSSF